MKAVKYKLVKAKNKDKVFYVIKEDIGVRFPNWVICKKENGDYCVYDSFEQAEKKYNNIVKKYEYSLCNEGEEVIKQYEV